MKTSKLFFTISLLFNFAIAYNQAIKIDCNGKVGINGNPSSTYDVVNHGQLYVTGRLSVGGSIWSNGIIETAGDLKCYKDLTLDGQFYGSTLNFKNGAKFKVYNGLRIEGDGNQLHIGMGVNPSSNSVLKVAGEYTSYALYIEGNTRIYGNLWYGSDENLKKNIKNIDSESNLEKLLKLVGKIYEYKDQKELRALYESGSIKFSKETIITTDSLTGEKTKKLVPNIPYIPGGKHYGLLAQEVEPVFPELVMLDSADMTYSVNYTGFIPILIEAIKEQNKKIAALENEIQKLKKKPVLKSASGIDDDLLAEIVGTNTLYQNVPNPFNETTQIDYYLEDDVSKAVINIYNLNGTQIKSIPLYTRGKDYIKIHANELTAGMYIYSLIADNKEIDNKRMILTD